MFHDDLRLTEQLRAALQENRELRAELERKPEWSLDDRDFTEVDDRDAEIAGLKSANATLAQHCRHLEAIVLELRLQLASPLLSAPISQRLHYEHREMRSPSFPVPKEVDFSQLFSAAEFRKAVDDAVGGSHG